FILGQQGDDRIFGGAGNDDLTGGHNVLFGADGNDYIDGGDEAEVTAGDGADVILGDNGVISREVLPGAPSAWRTYPAPFASIVIRNVVRFDDIDLVAGNDTLLGDAGQDILHGQRGSDVIDGGTGDDEVYGELGADTVTGGDGNDVVLGDVGLAQRAFNADGTPRLDGNGSWHRDIFLEDVGRITGVIRMDQMPLRLDDPALAAKLLGADLAVLGGSFLASGAKQINTDNGAWNTELILIDLVPADSDRVSGGAGDDLLFGQRGSDTLNGDAGNDLIFADGAFNSVPFGTTLPRIISGVRLIGAIDGTPYELAVGGSVIVPSITMQPLEFGSTLPRLNLVSNQAFGDLAAADGLRRTDGATTMPLLSFVPDVINHADALPGNDIIDGGAGADTIYADDFAITLPLFTGLAAVDSALADVQSAVVAVNSALHALSLDYELLQHLIGGSTGPHDIRIGNDTILGGDGEDTIAGDNALITIPFAAGTPGGSADFTTSALRFHSFLRDLEYVAGDFVNATQEAHLGVLRALIDDSVAKNPARDPKLSPAVIDPNFHHLFIGNDNIDGGFGNDVITGDQTVTVIAVLPGRDYSKVANALGVTATVLSDTNAALSTQQTLRGAELTYHRATHVGDWSDRTPDTADLRLIPAVFEYDLDTGNDTVRGGAGNDLLIGDQSVFILPLVTTARTPVQSEVDISLLVADLSARLTKAAVTASALFGAASLNHAGGNRGVALRSAADVMTGDAGNDVIFSKQAAVVVPIATTTGQPAPLDLGLSRVETTIAFPGQAALSAGRTLTVVKDTVVDRSGTNSLLIETGNVARPVIKQTRDLIFGAFAPQFRTLITEVAATAGAIVANGDGSVLPPGGSVVRTPTLDVAITVLVPASGNRIFTLNALLNGLPTSDRFSSVWQILDSTGAVVASGVGAQEVFNVQKSGEYRARVIVTDLASGAYGIAEATLRVNTLANTMNAGLTGPTKAVTGQVVTFKALLDGKPAGGNYNVSWQVFDSANVQIGGGLSATLSFAAGAADTYKVQVTFTDPATNATETTFATLTVTATPAALNVAITGPATGVRGALLTFEGLLNGNAAALNGSATWFVLDRKNAIVTTGSGPQFAFVPPALGNYTVQFQMVDPVTGLLGIATAPLTIPAPAPTFSIGINGPLQGVRGQQITLTTLVNGATLPAGYTAAWQIVDKVSSAVVAAGVGESFTFNPAAVGAYTVQLKLTETATGAVGTATSSLVITSPELTFTVGLTGPSGGEAGRILTFGGLLNGRAFDGNYAATWRVLDSAQVVKFTATGREISFAPTLVAPATTETFTIEFTLIDAVTGQTGRATLPILVTAATGAAFAQQTVGLSGPTVALTGQTLDYSVLIDGVSPGGTNHLAWSVFDSTNAKIATGSGAAFHYLPTTVGTVRVQVELQNNANQVLASASTSLVLAARPPVISAGVVGPVTGVRGQLLMYQALLGAGAPTGFTKTWQVLDTANAVVVSGAGDQLIFSSPNAGQFRVRFTLADNTGAGISAVTSVNITAATSVMDVNFTGPIVGTRGQTLNFAALLEGGAIPAGLVTTWTVRNAAGAVVATNVGERLAFVPAAAGRFTVDVSIADPITGSIGLASAPLSVNTDAPSLTLAITGPLVATRGQTVLFSGDITGGALPPSANAFWNITDDRNAVVAQGSGTQLAFAPSAAGRYVVRFTVTNPANGAFGSSDAELDVTSGATVTPGTIAISGPTLAVAGQTLRFTGVLDGKAIIGDFETVWRVLDSTSTVLAVAAGHAFDFTPPSPGVDFKPVTPASYTIELTLKDRLTGVQTVVTSVLTLAPVSPYYLTVDDPAKPGSKILIVGGTEGNDVITFSKSTTTPGAITLNFEQKTGGAVKGTEEFASISRIEVHAGLGDDTITIAPSLTSIDVMFNGGAGRDVLNGGAGNDVLLGGFGDDTLSGGPGADRLDGGPGSDQVRGGDGADFLMTTGGSDQLLGEEGNDTIFAQPLTPGARVTIDGGTENDTINIPATNGASIAVKTGAGVNVVNLGTSAGVLAATGGTVDGLRGRIDISGGDFDIVNLDASASTVGRTWKFGSGLITGFAGPAGSIALHGVGLLNASLGRGDDRATFTGSAATTTKLRDNGGSEMIVFTATDAGSTTNLLLGDGVNQVDFGGASGLDNVRGTITLDGSGADSLTFDDAVSKSGRTMRLTATGLTSSNLNLTYTGFASLKMKLGAGADVLTIDSTAAIPVTIETGLGNDKVTVRA
ncbi:MAG: PKD domain-containing protein, partial [Chthoniobacteraceae bacterium]